MSTTTINFTLQLDDDTFVDADSLPILRDATATFGVKRNDTSAVVVAANTVMVRDSLGHYHYTFTDPVANLIYTYAVEYVYDGDTNWLQDTKAGTTGEVVGRYSTWADAQNLITSDNLTIAGDGDDDGDVDAGIDAWAVDLSDNYIDLYLAENGITVPVDTDEAAAHVVAALRDIGSHATVLFVWHRRGIAEAGRNPEMAGLMQGYKTYIDEQLARLVTVLQLTDADDDAEQPGTFGFVPIVRTCVSATDENSN